MKVLKEIVASTDTDRRAVMCIRLRSRPAQPIPLGCGPSATRRVRFLISNEENSMKSVGIKKALGCVVAVIFALNAYAANSDTAATPSAATAPSSKTANRALARKIHGVLAKTKGLDPTHIYVKAVGGVVTLTGSAETGNQID